MKDRANGHADPREITVAGRRVWLRERLPLKEGKRIVALAQAVSDQDLDTALPLLALLIERWEFDGDPSDAASYENLDVFSEVLPLLLGVGPYVQAKLEGVPKAPAGASSSP